MPLCAAGASDTSRFQMSDKPSVSPDSPTAFTDTTFDVIVVGGGIVGCASAFYLTRRGMQVAVVERAAVGGGTTSNSFAWINATSKVADEAYHRLNALGQATYRELAREYGEARIGLNPSGMLQWVRRSDEAGYQSMSEQARKLKEFGYASTWIGREELTTLEPHVEFDDDVEALYAMGDPCLDAPFFARFLADEVRGGGGAVFENCAARELQMTDEGAVTGLVTDQGTVKAPRVLVAAGPGTPEVLSELTGYDGFAARFPMNRVPGLLVTSPSTAPHQLLRHIVYTLSGDAFHMLPAPNGGIKIGADDTDGLVAEQPPLDSKTVLDAAAVLLERARAMIPAFPGKACLDDCRIGIGVRPYPQDGKTLAGELPGAEGLYVIATHSGVTLSPAVGQLMSELIAEGRRPEQLEPFGLDRFQAFG